MTLKEKTLSGLFWSFVDNFANLGIQFVVGIILARMLSPREFGLIGMITIFIAISQTFVDSGFRQALIRKSTCTQSDYSTVFYFNLAVGIFFYIILFILSPFISNFYNEPSLSRIIRIVGLTLIINALTVIQFVILTKNVDFKLQARISVFAGVGSGFIGILFAILGYGVWSLVALQISKQALNSLLLWLWNGWRPALVFSRNSFSELFGFGSKLLISGIIGTVFQNIYYIVIGKYFSAIDLGFYTRGEQFKNLPAQNLVNVVSRVTFPVLSSIQDDIPRLGNNYRKLIRSTMFISFVLMLGLAAMAKPLILTLIGEKWLTSVSYLQLLCFVGMLLPLHALNLNMLQVLGRSDLFLKLEIIKRSLTIPTIITGVIFGIKIMIVGMFVNSLIALYLNSYWSGKMIGYSFKQQILDIMPSLLMALLMSSIVFSLSFYLKFSSIILLFIQIATGAVLVILISEMTKLKDYFYIKELIFEKTKDILNNKNGKTN
jgi:teichuronic acid exporter